MRRGKRVKSGVGRGWKAARKGGGEQREKGVEQRREKGLGSAAEWAPVPQADSGTIYRH